MNISRDNYELYFLMYVDNELSAAERNAVEVFVAGNPDLKEEMDILLSTKLPQENIVFVPKTLLYKNEAEIESVHKALLLHLDGELSFTEASALNKQIAGEEAVAAEWMILQKTKLDPADKMIFPDKALLYRHTNNIVSFRFWRVAAAILLLAGILTGITLYDRADKVEPGIVIQNEAEDQFPVARIKKDPVQKAGLESKSNDVKVFNDYKENIVKPEDNSSKKALAISNKNVNNKNISGDNSNKTALQNVREKEDVMPVIREVQPEERKDNALVSVLLPSEVKEIIKPLHTDTDEGIVRQSFAKLVSSNNNTEDRILYMNEETVNRSKVGGFFRKVKRVVERNTKIKTSNGIRIGGFEFALK